MDEWEKKGWPGEAIGEDEAKATWTAMGRLYKEMCGGIG